MGNRCARWNHQLCRVAATRPQTRNARSTHVNQTRKAPVSVAAVIWNIWIWILRVESSRRSLCSPAVRPWRQWREQPSNMYAPLRSSQILRAGRSEGRWWHLSFERA
eukprot:365817-Chlamydomonas_euryale.AAC.18